MALTWEAIVRHSLLSGTGDALSFHMRIIQALILSPVACCIIASQPSSAIAATCGEILSRKIEAARTWMTDRWYQIRNPGAPDRGTLRQLRQDPDGFHRETNNILISFSYFGTDDSMTPDEKDEISERFLLSGYRERGGKLYWKPVADSDPRTVNDAISRIVLETDFEFLSSYLSQRLADLDGRAASTTGPELEMIKRRSDLIKNAFEDYPPRI